MAWYTQRGAKLFKAMGVRRRLREKVSRSHSRHSHTEPANSASDDNDRSGITDQKRLRKRAQRRFRLLVVTRQQANRRSRYKIIERTDAYF